MMLPGFCLTKGPVCVGVCVCLRVRVLGVGYCCLLNFACFKHRASKSYAMTQACCALKAGAMVTDMLAPAL